MSLHHGLLLLLCDRRPHLLAALLQNRAGQAARRSNEFILSGSVVAVGSILWFLGSLRVGIGNARD